MNDKQITAFFEVAECLSFSKAAQNLFLTQPTVTHQITSLESEIGVSLFNRGHRSISLTPAGLHLYKSMKGITQQIRDTIQRCQSLSQYYSRSLAIGHYSPEGDSLFYQAIQAFTSSHEDFSIDIRLPATNLLCEYLLQHQLDAVIIPRSILPHMGELTSVALFSNPEYCIMSHAHPLASLPEIRLDQLTDTLCMLHDPAHGKAIPWHEEQIRLAQKQDLPLSGHTMREMITNLRSQPCVMFSLYPLMFISNDLVRIPFSDGPRVETVLAWRKDNSKLGLQTLIDFLTSFYRENQ